MRLAEKIAGEIVMSERPGATLRKWREEFGISQQELARYLGISPSVISDYEAGRRRSPGAATIRRIINALIEMDRARGGSVIKRYEIAGDSGAIIDIREMPEGVGVPRFIDIINGHVVNSVPYERKKIYGYTAVDSIKAIVEFSSTDYHRLYGWSSQRAIIFGSVKYGRSPMIAIRAHPLTPAVVVYAKPERVDPLAVKLADLENVVLVVSEIPVERMVEVLRDL